MLITILHCKNIHSHSYFFQKLQQYHFILLLPQLLISTQLQSLVWEYVIWHNTLFVTVICLVLILSMDVLSVWGDGVSDPRIGTSGIVNARITHPRSWSTVAARVVVVADSYIKPLVFHPAIVSSLEGGREGGRWK